MVTKFLVEITCEDSHEPDSIMQSAAMALNIEMGIRIDYKLSNMLICPHHTRNPPNEIPMVFNSRCPHCQTLQG